MNETATGNLLAASKLFNWVDYATFGSLLGLSALIGIYYGCIKGTKNSKVEYMLGGKSMHVFPIAMSLITRYEVKLRNVLLVTNLDKFISATFQELPYSAFQPKSMNMGHST